MSSQIQRVRSLGIYHGLPVYDGSPESSITGLTALITGANGMSGHHLLKVLLDAPSRWKKIYCLSRKPPSGHADGWTSDEKDRVQHISVDFLSSPEEIGKVLKEKKLQMDYIFFFSYVQPRQSGALGTMWSDAKALSEVNSRLLHNFLGGLTIAGVKPRRFFLQTGGKHYGVHLGPVLTPTTESDPRVTLEENFYYRQQDMLSDWCKTSNVRWNVARPSIVDGAVQGSSLNYLVGLAVYAAVEAHLGRPLRFPASIDEWARERSHSSATLDAHFEEWIVLNRRTENQSFNIVDGSAFTWGRLWILLAQWYGTAWLPPVEEDSEYRISYARYDPPPRGYGKGVTRTTFSFVEWSQKPEVVDAWKELTYKHNLTFDPFEDRGGVFGLTDVSILHGWPFTQSISKARHFGWLGTVDTYESIFQTLSELGSLGVCVSPVVKEYKPWKTTDS
ncbi:hypothetical protein BKA64DRAFT_714247 [Cadophora sp. MPI-SDFR-AT-0126]|nr:hypothetical protein BKA61DRAFT_636721 [Leptodontidium sp. MPI-SDFR-AT-0119]KAH7379073.1 hypothetical protein BKA64DRAFT_714247 [Leotiomycetes sp. MPI-SDFR-AT-0126]